MSQETEVERLLRGMLGNSLLESCLEWHGQYSSTGYGRLWWKGKHEKAHRVVYCLANEVQIDAITNVVIRHKCDNPKCVNPVHLESGTYADNSRDMIDRGRGVHGESHAHAKLTREIAQEIRIRYRPRCRKNGQRALARQFGVSQSTVHDILTGKTWSHVP